MATVKTIHVGNTLASGGLTSIQTNAGASINTLSEGPAVAAATSLHDLTNVDSSGARAANEFVQYDSDLEKFTFTAIDSSYINTNVNILDSATILNIPALWDSADTTSVIDSAYIQLRDTPQDFAYGSLTGAPNVMDSATILAIPALWDSANTTGVIDSAYVQLKAPTAYVKGIVDSAHVQLMAPAAYVKGIANEAYIDGFVDAALINSRVNILDSANVTAFVDSAYVQLRQIKYSTADFTDSAYVTSVLPTLGGDFVDSSYVTSLPVSTFTNDADYLDSTTVTGVINSTYVQNNQIKYTNADFTDSAFVSAQINALIDGAPGTLDTLNEIAAALNDDDSAVNNLTTLINAKDSDFVKSAADQTWIQSQQIKYTTADFTDSAYVTSVLPTLGGDFVDSAYVTSVLPTLGGDFVDSAYVTSVLPTLGGDFVDSAFVTSLPISTFTNDADYLDSTTVLGVIDQTYVQNNQIKYTTADFTDSAYVTSVLPTLGGDYVDSAYVTGLPVSTFANDADYLDSTTVLGVIDQTYVQNNQIKYTTADFTDSAYVTSVLPTLGGDFVDSAQVSAIIIADVVKSFVDALNINATALGGNDSDYYRLNVYDSAGVLLN